MTQEIIKKWTYDENINYVVFEIFVNSFKEYYNLDSTKEYGIVR